MSTLLKISAAACIAFFTTAYVSASVPAALTGSDNPGYSFGFNVAINGDTAVVASTGGIYVFVKPSTGWESTTQTAKLGTSDGASLFSVAISGNTIVAGSYLNGEAFVWVEPAGGWADMTQETAKLTPSDGFSGDFFGYAVAIAGDTVVVGAAQNNSLGGSGGSANPGAAYVFVKPAGGWVGTTETAELSASDGKPGDGLGWSVAVSPNAVVAGAPNANVGGNSNQGAVYVFAKPAGGWINGTQKAKLTNPYIPYVDSLGEGVSISGNTIAATGFGLAFVFVEPAGGWTTTSTPTAQLTESPSHSGFGNAVSICANVIVIAAPGNSPGVNSAADVYDEPAGGWTNMTESSSKHSPVDGGHGNYGWSVGVSGQWIIVGYPELSLIDNPYGMAAYVY
jgi:hypothetical protein